MRRVGFTAALASSMLLGGAVPAHRAAAQAPPERKAWLGVALSELLECHAPRKNCLRKVVVSQVVVDGPADRAGVQPGDTLLAVDGRPLATNPWLQHDGVFSGMREGRRMRVLVSRGGRRLSLDIVPDARPTGAEVVRIRTASGAVAERRVMVDPPPPPDAPRSYATPLVIQGERGGVYYIRPASPADSSWSAEVRVLEGDGWVELRTNRGGERGVRGDPSEVRVRIPLEGAVPGARRAALDSLRATAYVRFDPGPELRAVQDSVFRAARMQLDSLRERLERQRYRTRNAAARTPLPRTEAFAWRVDFRRSVAGAEFEPLTPELAEFFDGAEEGLLCLRVVEGTPADRLGLRPGDVVIEAAGRPVTALEDLRLALLQRYGDGSLEVRWIRKGHPMRGVLRRE